MSAKHTPGPWEVRQSEYLSTQYIEKAPQAGADYLIEIGRVNGWKDAADESVANARLIAAAPELLEALNTLDSWLVCWPIASAEDMGQSFDAMQKLVAKAIAKATGESQ